MLTLKPLGVVCFFIALLHVFYSQNVKAQHSGMDLTQAQLLHIADKIYQNETGAKPENLIAWNNGESFVSAGIGHFIWFADGHQSRFTETFPDFIEYLIEQKVEVPYWMLFNRHCPWSSKKSFAEAKAKETQQWRDLQALLLSTFEFQISFIHLRMQAALPKILATIDSEQQKALVAKEFTDLSQTELGLYTLIDYINFKGEGVSQSERYQNQGWGLLQVLLGIDTADETNIHMAFSESCKRVLSNRVENSPQRDIEKNWLLGWHKRCATYSKF
ncbi:MAG: hypothetical protein ABJK64_09060 [Paraglaciecola sp.]|uniref:hypothetical protein n=1 Tax=Paraglaciecola sp. TaxID=1920173 RepID=UPI0032997602